MANTLTGLIPTIYDALHVSSREMIGMIPAVRRDARADQVAMGQVIRSPIGEAGALEDISAGATPADSGDTTVGYVDITLSKSKAAPVRWNGEEQLGVGATGQLVNVILRDQFADGFRKLGNAIEQDLIAAAKANASRAYGTAGTTPLGTAGDLSDLALIAKILDDNGAPTSDRQIVVNSATMANLRGKQSVLFKVNEAGSADMLRDGMTDRLQNMALRYSGLIAQHTKGTGTSYQTSAAGVIGDTSISADTGSGTLLAGDIVTFAADTANKYVANSALSGGSFALGNPGLLAAIADNNAITIGNSYTPNFAFDRNSIVLAARAPAMPIGGDSADDVMSVTDPVTGLTFQIALYRQYRQVKYEIGITWGTGVSNSAHIATLLG